MHQKAKELRFFCNFSVTNPVSIRLCDREATRQMSQNIITNTFIRLHQRLMWQARSMLLSQEDAEDALQDAFVRLWPRADRIKNDNEAEALVTTTIRHLAIDHSRTRQPETLSSNQPSECIASDDHKRIEDSLQLAEVEQMMQQTLSPLQMEIIRLREYEGRQYEEIAEQLQMQQAAVRMQLSRARKALRNEYRQRNQPINNK